MEGPSEHPWRIWRAEDVIFRVTGEEGTRYRATGRVNADGSIELVMVKGNRGSTRRLRQIRNIRCERLIAAHDKVRAKG